MKFLHEEFFGKLYHFIDGINIATIRLLAKLLFYGLIAGILFFIVWGIYHGKQKLIFWIVSLLIIAEIAHFIRKSRERVIGEKLEEESHIKSQLANADLIDKHLAKSAANKGLLKESFAPNKKIKSTVKKKLKIKKVIIEPPKNKELLKKK